MLQLDHWEIVGIAFVDDYGIKIKDKGNGSQFIPEREQYKFTALTMVEHTGMSYSELMNLRYDNFIELSLLVKSVCWVAPSKTPRDKEIEEHQRRLRR